MSFIPIFVPLLECILLLLQLTLSIILAYFLISCYMGYPPSIPTSGNVKAAMLRDAAQVLSNRSNQIIMDLGSGWGTLLLPLAKQFPNHKFIGIERARLPYLVSKFRAQKMKNITFYRENFFNSDISKANIIFLFLMARTMGSITAKCLKEAQKNTLIYVNRFPMENVKTYKEVSFGSKYNTYYIYKI